MATPTHVTLLSDFQQLIAEGRPVVVDVHADWCGPCKAIAPTFDQWAATHGGAITFLKVDTGAAEAELVALLAATALPTFIMYRGGAEVKRSACAMPSLVLLHIEALLQ
jgi:thiol-disulfide isomerase/thioredoxin